MESNSSKSIYKIENDKETFSETTHIINFILITFGITDNICCMLVFMQKKLLRLKFNWYLLVITVFELIYCSIAFIDYATYFIHPESIFLHGFNLLTNITIDLLLHLIDSFIIVLKLILSIDRLQAIQNPKKVKQLVTYSHSKLVVIATFIILFLIKLPDSFLCHNSNIDEKFNVLYCTIYSPLVLNIIPVILILITNSLLVFRLVHYYTFEYKQGLTKECIQVHTGYKDHEIEVIISKNSHILRLQKTCYLMIVLTIFLVFTTVPYYMLNRFYMMFYLFGIGLFSKIQMLNLMQDISSIFFNSNHCINFSIQFYLNSEFRKCFLNLLNDKVTKKTYF